MSESTTTEKALKWVGQILDEQRDKEKLLETIKRLAVVYDAHWNIMNPDIGTEGGCFYEFISQCEIDDDIYKGMVFAASKRIQSRDVEVIGVKLFAFIHAGVFADFCQGFIDENNLIKITEINGDPVAHSNPDVESDYLLLHVKDCVDGIVDFLEASPAVVGAEKRRK